MQISLIVHFHKIFDTYNFDSRSPILPNTYGQKNTHSFIVILMRWETASVVVGLKGQCHEKSCSAEALV